jgi:hypothetical protein
MLGGLKVEDKNKRIEDVLQFFDKLQDKLLEVDGDVCCGYCGKQCPAYKICKNADIPCSVYLKRYIDGNK